MNKLLVAVGALKNLGKKDDKPSSMELEEEVEELRRRNRQLTRQLDELQLFRNLIDASNDAVYVADSVTGRFLEVNEQSCKTLGYSREELLCMKVPEIDYDLNSSGDWEKHILKLKADNSLVLERFHQTRDGDTFPVEINIKLIERASDSYVIGIARDISEQRRIRENLIEEKNKLEAVLAALGDGLTVQDTNFRILYQNAAHRRKQGEQVGKYCYQAYQDKPEVCEGCLLEKCFADGMVHRRETSAAMENGVIHMEVSASPVKDAHGNIVAGIETIRDITERKDLEDQLLQAQKMEAVGRLSSGIAHDFNNLLTTIVGYSDLLLMSLAEKGMPDREELQDNLISIREAGGKATTLTRQLLAFSRKQAMELRVVDLNQIIENFVKILGRLIGDDIQFEMKLEPGLGNIKADSGQIEQILMNLAVNARDAMPEGGRLYLETGKVIINEDYARRQGDLAPGPYVALTLTDTGEGISSGDKGKIFDPFFTTKSQGEGTGLGLSTVHGIVMQHKGTITVISEPAGGTTFKILLPVTEKGVEENDRLPESVVLQGQEKVLVVDDEPSIRSLILDTLSPMGFEVLEAGSGEEALHLCREMKVPPDLLLTDLVMPEMKGRELARRLTDLFPELKVLFMSGYPDQFMAEASPEEEADFLSKPIVPSILIDKLHKVLELP